MKECVEYARSLNPAIRLEFQTNGLFKTNEDTEWIAKNFNAVWFSLDGPKEVNDKHRPDANGHGRTSDIEENLRFVQKHTFVGIRATVVEETMNNQDLLVDYYHNMGVKNVCLNPVIMQIVRNESGKTKVTGKYIGIRIGNRLLGYAKRDELVYSISKDSFMNIESKQ